MESIVRGAALKQNAVSALHDVAQRMLSSTRSELLAHALKRIFDVVPAAQRVAVVAWPPDPTRGFVSLLGDEDLRREGIPVSPVSTSMARHAVETREALYFVGGSPAHSAIRNAPSVLAHQIHSAIYVPLLDDDGDVIALLCVDTPRPGLPIAPNDFPFICAVAALLTAALRAEGLRVAAQRRELEMREQKIRRDALANCMRVASHDLKNPLVVIQLATHLMAKTAEAEERQMLSEQVQRAVSRSNRLIKTYLEASEALTGRTMAAQRQPTDPKALVDEEIEFLALMTGAPSIDNRISCRNVAADAEKLRQIFANLIGNAVKYSPPGASIDVSSEETDTAVSFHVTDRGVGISPEDQERLFRPFERVGDVSATQGTGLGLWITQTLVRAHGGDITVKSEPGVGSRFTVRLPRA